MSDDTLAHNLSHLSQTSSSRGISLPGVESVAPVGALAGVEEQQLVAQARAGDQDAFGALVRLHQRRVYHLALRMLRDPEEASEATQEVFLSAWQGLRGFRGDARFATWLYRIAYNHCLKVAEQRRKQGAAQAELLAESAREQAPAVAYSASQAREAEREMRETVQAEIANLPPKYRAVLALRHLQDLSYEEMAEILRLPIGTVKTHLFRARAMLKDRLTDLSHARDEGLAKANDLRAGVEAGLRSMLVREQTDIASSMSAPEPVKGETR